MYECDERTSELEEWSARYLSLAKAGGLYCIVLYNFQDSLPIYHSFLLPILAWATSGMEGGDDIENE